MRAVPLQLRLRQAPPGEAVWPRLITRVGIAQGALECQELVGVLRHTLTTLVNCKSVEVESESLCPRMLRMVFWRRTELKLKLSALTSCNLLQSFEHDRVRLGRKLTKSAHCAHLIKMDLDESKYLEVIRNRASQADA
jgi:hypothetical protein